MGEDRFCFFYFVNQYTDLGVNHPLPTDSARYIIEAIPAQSCLITSNKYPTPAATSLKSSKSNGSERVVLTSAPETNKEKNIVVYPNPGSDVFTITGYVSEGSLIQVYNALGELVYGAKMLSGKSQVSLADFPSGVYQLEIISADKVVNKKIIIE